jgi:UDP:flavonoid glycosyltransferase YjiC (YdhE family)
MIALMRHATLYAGGLGTTFLEALAAGLPCVGVTVAPDQKRAAEAAKALGVLVLDAPDAEAFADLTMQALASAAPFAPPPFPDGKGAERLADALLRDSS